MQVHYDEGIANRIGPESCAGTREGAGEALTGVCIGQPLSRESEFFPGADVVLSTEGNMDGRANASARTTRRDLRPWHVQKLLVREPGDLTFDQQPRFGGRSGPHREGEEPQPMMHEREKSDFAIVAEKPANKAEVSFADAAEPVERRAGTKRNAREQSTYRTQSRARVSQALQRVRQAARQIHPWPSMRFAVRHSR